MAVGERLDLKLSAADKQLFAQAAAIEGLSMAAFVRHNRKVFSCGVAAQDRFLQQQAQQTMRRGVSQTFVLVPAKASTPT